MASTSRENQFSDPQDPLSGRGFRPNIPPPEYQAPNQHAILQITESTDSRPPDYEDAINPNLPPPTYDSLYGRVVEARKQSNNSVDFFKNCIILILGTIGCSIIIGATIVVPLAMIVIGIMYMDECPKSKDIPIFLVVLGFMAVTNQCLDLWMRATKSSDTEGTMKPRIASLKSLLGYFILSWFVIGSIVVYRAYEPSYNPNSNEYCNRTLYMFAFWFYTCFYLTTIITTCCLCTVTILALKVIDSVK